MSTTTNAYGNHDRDFDYETFGSGDEMVVLYDTEDQAAMDSRYDRVYRAYRAGTRFMPTDFTPEEVNMLVGLMVDGARYPRI